MHNADTLFEEVKDFYGKKFIDKHTKKIYTFIGVMVSEDDYYYTMYSNENGIQNLSCVGNIEDHGYVPIETIMSDNENFVDVVVTESLLSAYKIAAESNRIDCSDCVIDPDDKLLNAFKVVLNYYGCEINDDE